jgi:hypothetical protein
MHEPISKLLLLKSKGNFQGVLENYLEPEPQFGFVAPWSRGQSK